MNIYRFTKFKFSIFKYEIQSIFMTEPSPILSNHQESNIKYFIYSGLAVYRVNYTTIFKIMNY